MDLSANVCIYYIELEIESQYIVVLNFKMSHSMRNYGDETNDKNNNSMGVIRTRDTKKPYRQTS
jgi:hypothetical protein